MSHWDGKAVVVTGGARGQGAAESLALLRAGARVYAVDVHPDGSDHWDKLRAESGPHSSRLETILADVASATDWARVADRVADAAVPLYGLVNNAGITLRKTVTETSLHEWDRVLNVNLTGAFLGTRTLSPLLVRGGAIVNISSTAGLTGYFGAAYTAGKWGLRGLTKASALELAPRGIRVNCICPGLVETPMIHAANSVHSTEDARVFHAGNLAATPLGRGGDPTELAAAVMFLLGPDSSFVNAADLPVDGGMVGGGIYWRIGQATGNLGGVEP
ncbi:SDR family oxidoreductase [Rhodococcus sp. ABRD24]|uniref:SDR family NAD(P)-dependent oxidoreductase n=1 Tax=Rhodococcus sp. ABRD24 TaxID=2507582 RepID=UPI001038F35C|nr:SDR family NAD(P)-dependent oxidoreductase [Rhodococcus sp. ABRD24]QBJ96821.1 SDR family oxidoreductase [Rhodococcus sp. ABRD24]